jgi:predicted phosphate transport protein (TIGR00153 family)
MRIHFKILRRLRERGLVGKVSVREALFELSKMEMDADALRRRISEELTKGEYFPEEREDLMELVRAVDWIADWAREAGRILNVVSFEKLSEDMRLAAANMCEGNKECVTTLMNCIEKLSESTKEALDLADEVERWEEKIDGLYDQARRILATLNPVGITVGQLILLNEFLDAVETVADWCENTADLVRVIAVRLT